MTTLSRSERAREADLCLYHPPSLAIPDLRAQLDDADDISLPPPHHDPRPSKDAVLNALAQLGALRLDAAHVLISLVDSQAQIVLAEATQNTPLTGPTDALWLGCAVIPRASGICERVLDEPAVVVNDLVLDQRFQARSFVRSSPHFRFYAGVPLKTPTGSVIGAYSIFGTSPRDGLAEGQLSFLQGVAASVVSYLGASKAHNTNRKAEHMIRGLASFVTGAADVQAGAELDKPRVPENPSSTMPLPARTTQTGEKQTPSDDSQDTSQDEDSPSLQDSILPSGAKRMFARAANIVRESCGLSGVIFFDASMANDLPTGRTPPQTSSDDSDRELSATYSSSTAEGSSSSTLSTSSSTSHQPTCKILGFADASRSSRDGSRVRKDYLLLTEASLRKFLNRHPHGKIFNIARQGADDVPMKRTRRGRTRHSTAVDAIIDVAHNARSAAIIPLWDYNRQRWFAGCLCWVTDPKRVLTHGSDLLYLRAFGHSIMAEMGRIDTAAMDKARTTFIESMSHELRSPLHGILGGVEFLQSMRLDTFQANVVYSIAMCGRTLLDTVQNVLEYSKINEFTGPYAKTASTGALRLRRSSTGRFGTNPAIDLRRLTEETVEAIFAGHSYHCPSPHTSEDEDYFSDSPSPVVPPSRSSRKAVRIILDLPARHSWVHAVQPGIWRRILMNVFGNALRFTETGFIRVALSANDTSETESEVLLTVSDSGIGMSSEYIQNGLFKPFSQENPFSAGTGLGMSIVQRLVQSLNGEISVKSQVRSGTTVQTRVMLPRRPALDDDFETGVAARAHGRNISVARERSVVGNQSRDVLRASERQFHESLTNTLETWFGVNLSSPRGLSEDSSQLIIYPGPSFNSMFKAGTRRGVAVVIALDGIEAATLRADPRVTSGWIEVITQPCGPSKLASVLDRYMSRLDPESNAPLKPDIVRSPALTRTTPVLDLPFHPPSAPPGEVEESFNPEAKPEQAITDPIPERSQHPRGMNLAQNSSASASSDSLPTAPTPPSSSQSSQLYHHQLRDEMERQRLQIAPPIPPPQPSPPPPPPSVSAQKDILIVDDNPLNLRLLSAFLNKAGFKRHTAAANGLEALNLFKKYPGRWSTILMDVSMPVMDGVTATREIRAWERILAAERLALNPKQSPLAILEHTASEDSVETVRRWSKGAAEASPPDELVPPPPPPPEPAGTGASPAPSASLPLEKGDGDERTGWQTVGRGRAGEAASPPPVPPGQSKGDAGGGGSGHAGETGERSGRKAEAPSAEGVSSSPSSPGRPSRDPSSPSFASSPLAPASPSASATALLETPTPTGPAPASSHQSVQIIVITGLGSATARFEATGAGADVFMTKPIKFGMLMKTLRGRMKG